MSQHWNPDAPTQAQAWHAPRRPAHHHREPDTVVRSPLFAQDEREPPGAPDPLAVLTLRKARRELAWTAAGWAATALLAVIALTVAGLDWRVISHLLGGG